MDNRRGTVREAWDLFRTKVYSPTTPPIQLMECRRAFYAGAEILMLQILNGLSPGPNSMQSDEDYLAALHDEIHAFAADVKAGRA
jgi:hypothetical protein